MPTGLVKILLLMAGIESNPGPVYICPVCLVKLKTNSTSVQCNNCLEWVHHRRQNNCSELISTKDYDKSYKCPSCRTNPTLLSAALPRLPIKNYLSHPASQHLHTPPSSSPPPPPPSSPPPPPPSSPPPPINTNQDNEYDLNILQWNCNGISSKLTELSDFIHQNDIKIAVLQETKLGKKSTNPNLPNFTLIRKDRTSDKGGGLATYVHKSLMFMNLPDTPPDGHTETLGVKVGDTNILNVYIPPVTSCTTGFKPNIPALLPPGDALVLGDFNAHDNLWHSSIQDTRGTEIADEIGNSSYCVLNENLPTRVPSNGQPTSPDISLASTSIITSTEWNTKTCLGSDHLPIIIKIKTPHQKRLQKLHQFQQS